MKIIMKRIYMKLNREDAISSLFFYKKLIKKLMLINMLLMLITFWLISKINVYKMLIMWINVESKIMRKIFI